MRSLPQPIVARLQGYAYGAGFNLALGADFRVMARDAKLATPFIKRGLATGTNLLQQYVGIGKAIEMTLLGEPVDAEEALRLGLVNEVVDLADLGRGRRALGRAAGERPERRDRPDQARGLPGLGPGPRRGVLAPGLGRRRVPRPGGPGRGPGCVQGEAAAAFHRPLDTRVWRFRNVECGPGAIPSIRPIGRAARGGNTSLDVPGRRERFPLHLRVAPRARSGGKVALPVRKHAHELYQDRGAHLVADLAPDGQAALVRRVRLDSPR